MASFYFDDWNLEIDKSYFQEMQGIILDKEAIFIELIKRYAPKFDIKNMSLLYVLPIFIACAEIFYLNEEIPIKVSLNEAIELAKIYSDDSVKKIVNGILNNILEDYEKLNEEIKTLIPNQTHTFFNK